MKFVTNIDKKTYEKFVKKHPKSHFLQSYAWGEFSQCARKLVPHYVGLVDRDEKLVCAALLLQKHLPFGYSYFYAPRGFVIDFYNKKLLTEFVDKIKEYVKQYKAIFIKIDPDIIWREYNYLDEDFIPDDLVTVPRVFALIYHNQWMKSKKDFLRRLCSESKKVKQLGVKYGLGLKMISKNSIT